MTHQPYHQCQLLTEHIRAMIAAGIYGPGNRLPSIRRFAEQFNLSIGGVQRAIAKLEMTGLVESRRGAGIFVVVNRPSPLNGNLKRISVVLEQNPSMFDTYCAHVMRGIEEGAANHGYILELDYRGVTITPRELEEKAAFSDALILLGTRYDELLDSINFTCPIIGVEIGCRQGGKASVLSLDPFAAAELAVEFFRNRNCRTVMIYSAQYSQMADRAFIFQNRWRKYGQAEIRTPFISCQTGLEKPESNTDAANTPKSIFTDQHCGYLFTSSDLYRHALVQHQAEYECNPNEGIAILSYDGKPFLVPDYGPGHTVMPDWGELGRSAFNELLRRIRNPGCSAQRIYLDCMLKEYNFSTSRFL